MYVGTTGWSYPAWNGIFYPTDLKPAAKLVHYAKFFNTVEIESTFHNFPDPIYVRRWKETTPDDFKFSCLIPKVISHDKRLRDCHSEVSAFVAVIEKLETKLSHCVLSLPSNFFVSEELTLKKFIKAWPTHICLAIEFPSLKWMTPHINHVLHDMGVTRVWSERSAGIKDTQSFPYTPLTQTSHAIYLRLEQPLADGAAVRAYFDDWVLRLGAEYKSGGNVYIYVSPHFYQNSFEAASILMQLIGFEANTHRVMPNQMKLWEK